MIEIETTQLYPFSTDGMSTLGLNAVCVVVEYLWAVPPFTKGETTYEFRQTVNVVKQCIELNPFVHDGSCL